VIATDKDFASLRASHADAQKEAFATAPLAFTLPEGRFTTWDTNGIGTLRHTTTISSPSGTVTAYPTLIDHDDHVRVAAVANADEQDTNHWDGTLRLLTLAQGAGAKQVDRLLTNRQRLALSTSFWESVAAFTDDCVRSAVQESMRRFFAGHTADSVWSADEFNSLQSYVRLAFPAALDEVVKRGVMMAQSYAAIDQELQRVRQLTDVVADVEAHRDRLVYPGCLAAVSAVHHGDLGRYLVGIERRLERVTDKTTQDRNAMVQCRVVEVDFDRAVDRFGMNPDLEAAGWMLEELRLSLFAQTVGVKGKVSEKRIRTLIAAGSKERA
jgi:ATP-dependent helicase HrpA